MILNENRTMLGAPHLASASRKIQNQKPHLSRDAADGVPSKTSHRLRLCHPLYNRSSMELEVISKLRGALSVELSENQVVLH